MILIVEENYVIILQDLIFSAKKVSVGFSMELILLSSVEVSELDLERIFTFFIRLCEGLLTTKCCGGSEKF